MKVSDNSWRTFAVRTAVLGAVAFGAVRLAVARDGVAGGPARSYVTVAGNVAGLPGDPRSTTMRFTFHRAMREGGTMLCSPEVRDVPIAHGGAFAVQVPLDAMATPCPGDMFDGRDVEVDIAVGSITVVTNATINPVPYAIHADVAAVARRAEAASGALLSQLNASSHTRMRAGDEIRSQLDLPISATDLGGAGHTVLLSVTAVGPSLDIKRLYVVYISSSANFGACFSELGPGARFSPGGDVSVLNPILDATPMVPIRVVCNGIFFPGSGRPDDGLAGVVIRFERMPSSGWHWQYSTHILN